MLHFGRFEGSIRSTITLLVLALIAWVPAIAGAQELPPGPTTAMQSEFDAEAPSGAYEIVQFVLDFAPDAWTPRHTHGGQVFVTVLSGAMTVRDDDGTQTEYSAGATWRERPGETHVAGNAGSDTARILVTFLLPEGAALTTAQDETPTDELPPGPTMVHQFRSAGLPLSGAVKVHQLVVDFAPATFTPPHDHGGRGLVTVVQGTITVRDASGEKVYGVGESWVEGPGHVAEVGNATDTSARAVVSFVLAQGTPMTTVRESLIQMPAELPQTGGGGGSVPVGSATVAIAAALMALGLLSRRWTQGYSPRS